MAEEQSHGSPGAGAGFDELTSQQVRLLEAVLRLGSVAKAAAELGVAERTARRWAALPAFKEALLRQRRLAMEAVANELASGASEALAALRRVLKDTGAPPTAVVSAARTWLEAAREAVTQADLDKRLEKIESLAEGRLPSEQLQ